jgi:hypothetical protein
MRQYHGKSLILLFYVTFIACQSQMCSEHSKLIKVKVPTGNGNRLMFSAFATLGKLNYERKSSQRTFNVINKT